MSRGEPKEEQRVDFEVYYTYILCTVFAGAMIWLFYSGLHQQLVSTLTTLGPVLFSGVFMATARLKPEWLINVVGSGIGVGNLAFLLAVVVVVYVFGYEILKQARTG